MKIRALCCFVVLLTFSLPSFAEVSYVDPIDTSIAPGMNSCTSTKGCKKCVIPDGQTRETCATVLYEDGYCKCSTTTGSCQASGACKYVG
jgi:hypothetical protein